ncbi:unnamed protein product [Wuchereria bancrofti]|uniref:GOLD domain-containing protein n=1 Tax=Wuchereria bancrofti TaxID=6293 RepID=A0A3P7GG40_WUCBA|nr:unnamed protein product [Wuchereria bancrofti]
MVLSKIVAFCVIAFVKAIELTFELSDSANQCFFEDIKDGIDCVIEYQVVTGGQYDVDMTLEDKEGKILYKGVKKQYDSFSWKTETEGTYKACFSNEFSTFSHKVVYMDWQKGDEGQLLPSIVSTDFSLEAGQHSSSLFSYQLDLNRSEKYNYQTCPYNRLNPILHFTILKKLDIHFPTPDETLHSDVDRVTSRIAAMTQLETSASAIGDRLRLIDDYQTHHRLREATGRKRAEDLNERVLLWSLGQTAIIITLGIAQVTLGWGFSFFFFLFFFVQRPYKHEFFKFMSCLH